MVNENKTSKTKIINFFKAWTICFNLFEDTKEKSETLVNFNNC